MQYKVFNTADSTYLGVSRAEDDTAVTETITNLTNDTQYTVRVRAVNAVGDGPWSDEVSATPEAPPVLRSAQVDADNPTDIVLTYDKDLDTSKVPAVSAFTVTELPRGGTETSLTESSVAIDSANADTVTLTMDAELTAGFDVVVAYQPPDSNALQTVTGHEAAVHRGPALNRPAAPVVTLTPGDAEITASWPAPADGGDPITGYTVEYKLATDADTAYQEVTRTEGDTARTDTITGLANDTTYTVRVRARNDVGDSPNSNEPTDTPQLLVTAEFEAGSYVALEGRGAVTVTVTLSVAPERSVTIPIVVTPDGGATSDDYTVSADTVTFDIDNTEDTFTVTAEDDTVWDGEGNGETLTLSFGTLPPRVDPGTQATAEVSLIDNEIPLNSELVPDDIGIGLGDGFRLLFVTSGKRNAQSSSISAYNEFVQGAAASGHNDIRPYSSLIRALASTATVWARNNTATTFTPSEPGVPIWWLNGPRAADDYADFYYIDSPPTSPGDGWDHGDPAYNENGTVELAGDPCDLLDYVWTGSDSRGRTHSNRSLGFTGQARVGRPCTQGRELSFQDVPSSNRWPLYGLSDVLHVVAPDVPYVTGVEVDPVPDYDQFAVGDTIRVKVTFSEAVTVSGTPTFPLQIGSGTRDAVYQGADADSTDTVLVFTYVVGDVDTDTDKDGISNAEQTLGLPTNASIVDMTDDTVDAFPGLITLSTDFLVNGPPIIIDVEVTSSPQADSSNDTYGLGEDIEITVTFHEAVTVTGDVDFGFSLNGPRRAPLKSGNGTTEPVFAYTVQTGDDDDNGIWIGHPTHATNPTFDLQAEQSVVGVGSGLPALLEHDSVGPQADHKVDGSNTEADTTLSALSLSDGGADLVLVPAFAPGAAGTAVTSFVAMTDATSIVVSATASQSGGSSAVAISPADADANTTDHDVERTLDEVIDIIVTVTSTNGSSTRIYTVTVVEPDTTAPSVSQARVSDDGNKIEIVFDEPLATGSTVAVGEFDVTVGTASAVEPSGAALSAVDADTVVLTMTAAIAAGDAVTVDYEAPSTGGLTDAGSNQVVSFAGQVVANRAAAPVVSLTAGDAEIVASWAAPADGGSTITGYEVQHKILGAADSTYQEVTRADATALTETISLLNDISYTVRVRAVNAAGDGPWSNEPSATPVEPDTTAPSVSQARVFDDGNKIEIVFDEPLATGSTVAVGEFDVTVGTASAVEPSGAALSAVDADTVVLTMTAAIAAGDAVTVDYEAPATGGLADASSNTVADFTGQVVANRPAAPTGLTLEPGDGEIVASWAAPADGGSTITGYEVQRRSASAYVPVNRSDVAALTETITGLTNDTEYTVRVRAVNAAGNGPWSNELSATPAEIDDTAPSVDSAKVVEDGSKIEIVFDEDLDTGSVPLASAFAVTVDGVTPAITPSGVVIPSDDATKVVLSMPTGDTIAAGATVTVTYTDSDASPLQDLATDKNQVATFTDQAAPNRAAAPVVSLTAGDAEITAQWAAPADGGSTITGYEVQRKFFGAADSTYQEVTRADATELTETISLINDLSYTVRVRAVNAAGVGPWSNELSATPAEIDDTAPSVDSAKVVEDGSKIEIVFDEDLDSGSTVAADEFDVTVGTAAAVNPSGAALSAVDADTVVLTMTAAIAAGDAVTVDYTAPSTGGLADAGSNKVADFSSQVVANRPAAPTGLTLEPGDAEIVASWAAPANGGSTITGYEVQYKVFNTADSTYLGVSRAQDDTAVTETITNLTNDTQYTVRVRAANAVGDGPWSTEVSATPEAPPVLQSAQVDAGNPTDIVLTYDKDLDTSKVPAASAFTVTEQSPGGTETSLTESSVAIDSANADTVTLTMDAELTAGFDVVVAYLPPDSNALQSTTGHEAASFTNQAVLNRPAAPVVTLTPGDAEITADWDEPADGGSAITGYTVEYKLATDTAYQEWTRDDDTARTETITGLTNDTTYTVRVRATNAAGDSPNSNEPTDTPTEIDTYPAPGGPYLFGANFKMVVRWLPPKDAADDAALQGWEIQWRSGTEGWDSTSRQRYVEKGRDDDGDNNPDGLSFETHIGSLSNTLEYEFRIRARVTDLTAVWTDTASATLSFTASRPANMSAGLVFWALNDREVAEDILDRFDVVLRYHDSYTFTVNDEGLKEPVYLRSVWMEGYDRGESAPITGALIRFSGKGSCLRYGPNYDDRDRNGSHELTLLHPGATKADWEHVGYTGNVYQIPHTAFDCFEYREIRPSNAVGTAPNYIGRTTFKAPDPVPEVAALEPVVAGDGALTVRWQEQLWAGAQIFRDQFKAQPATRWTPAIQWVPADEQFESDSYTAEQNGAAHLLRGSELKEALLGAEYTITGLDNGTAYKVRFVYDRGGRFDDDTSSKVETGTPVDLTAPMAVSASISAGGETIAIVFNESLDTSGSEPAAAAFGVKVGSASAVEPLAVALSAVDADTVTLTLGTATEAGAAVSVAYGPPASNPLQDAAGHAVEAFDVSVPNRPAAPSPTAAPGNVQLTVKWFPPADGGSPITRYRVEWRIADSETDTQTWDEAVAAGQAATGVASSPYTVPDLTNDVEYTVRVRATNAADNGPWSNEVSATPQATDTTVPVPAYAFVDENAADEFKLVKIVFSEALVDTSGSEPAASAFAVTVGSGSAAAPSSVAVSGDTVTLTMAAAVTAGESVTVAYSVPAAATDPALADSAGNKVGSFAATNAIPVLNRPAAPAAPTLTAGESSLIAAWTAPADGGSPVTGYRVQWRIADSETDTQTWDEAVDAGQAATGVASSPYTVPDLTNDVEYTVRVIAVNAAGDSPPSAEASESPGDMTPPTPISAKVIDDGAKIEVTFNEPLDDTKSLNAGAFLALVTVGTTEDTHTVAAVRIEAATVTVTTVRAIPAGATVTLTYTAPAGDDDLADLSGNEVASFIVNGGITVLNRPAAPPLTLTAGDGELTVAWTEPANGGSAITGYRVEWRIADSQTDTQTWPEAVAAGQTSDHGADIRETTLLNLTNNTAYTVRVIATNAVGDSPQAEGSQTPADTIVPAPVSASVAADSNGDFKLIEIVFDEALVDTSGSEPAAAAFAVTVGSATAVSPSSVAVSGDTVTLTMSDVIAAGETVSVSYNAAQATNPLQDAAAHEAASFTGQAVLAVLNRPALTLTAGDGELTATWTAPVYGSSAAQSHRVEWRIADSQTDSQTWPEAVAAGQVASDVTSSPYTISNLAYGTEYTVRVTAVYAAGDGPPAQASATPFVDSARSVPTNWVLLPSGLSAGDEFRLLFVTSGRRNAASTDIDVYNGFVQTAAASGHDAIRHRSAIFRVVGSTAAVDAIDNTGTNYTTDDPGVAIWWLNGPNAADNYSEFYDGRWDHHDPGRDQNGNVRNFSSSSKVFTGSTAAGRGHVSGGFERVLGSSAPDLLVEVGKPGESRPIFGQATVHRSNNERFYGLSGVFVVGPDSASSDATLSALTVDSGSVPDFAATTTEYAVSVAASTVQVTVAAVATDDSGARVRYEPADADANVEGHQVDLAGVGAITTVTVTVIAANDASQDYTLTIGPPHVTGVEVNPEPAAGKYGTGDTIRITVTFSDDVAVTGGTPTFPLEIGSTTRQAAYQPTESTATTLVFAYTVVAADSDEDGIANAQSTLNLPAGVSIKDADDDTVNAYLGPIDLSTDFGVNSAPGITDFELSSTPQAANDTYGLGEDITFTVTFSEAVTVNGDVELGFSLSGRVGARLVSGNNTPTLVFAYTVQSGDSDSNGIFTLNQTGDNQAFEFVTGQSIVSAVTGVAADLDGMERGTRSGHKVDGNRTGADATLSALSLSGITLDQTFTAGAAGTAVTDFTVTTTASSTVVTATPSQSGGSSAVAISPADADTSTTDHDVALVSGEDTLITVTVTSTNGDSTRSYTITVTREPDTTAPSAVSAKVIDSGQKIEIVFDEDLDSSSTLATGEFNVQADEGSSEGSLVQPSAAALSTTDANTVVLTMTPAIAAGDTVTVFYTAPDTGGLADASSNTVVSFTDGLAAPNRPAAPGVPTLTADGIELTVVWTEPADEGEPLDGGSPITGYTVQWRTDAQEWGDVDVASQSASVETSPYVITDLAYDTEYTVRVIATNAVGDSPPSAETSASTGADPAVQVDLDWALLPSGLIVGDKFRLLFVTSGKTHAASTDIDDYNAFVQTAAASGHAAITDHSDVFRVLGSTADVDARDNTATTWTDDDRGVPIWWLNGSQAADDYADFYDGSWINSNPGSNENGAAVDFPGGDVLTGYVYTGSTAAGIEQVGNALGSDSARVGRPGTSRPLTSTTNYQSDDAQLPVYGLSGVFVVVDATAPSESSAKVSTDGTTVEVTFDEDLDTTRTPPPATAFTVTVDGTGVSPTGVAFHSTNANTIILTMGTAIAVGATVSVDYVKPTDPAEDTLADASGNEVAGFSGQQAAGRATTPTVSLALISADRTTIDIVFDEDLDTAAAPAASAFLVTVDSGTGVEPSSVAFHSTDADTITLTMAPAVAVGDTVSVTYSVPTENALVTVGGGKAGAFAVDAIVAVTVQFSTRLYTAFEGGSAAEVTLTLDTDPHRDVSIELLSVLGAVAERGDFSFSIGTEQITTRTVTLTFASGQTTASFTVTAVDDEFYDGNDNNEQIGLTLLPSTMPLGVTTGSPASTAVELVDNEFPAGSSLSPDGSGIGDEFRLLFVTSDTTMATSTDIDYYNKFVQDAVAEGHADIVPYSRQFRALGSTAAVSARVNTATDHCTADNPGVLISLLDGGLAAHDCNDLYGSRWVRVNPWPTESGEAKTFLDFEEFQAQGEDGVLSDLYIWTGSLNDGSVDPDAPLGTPASLDGPGPAVANPVAAMHEIASNTVDATNLLSLYGLSYVLRLGVPDNRPHVTGVAVVNGPDDGAYVTDDTITVEVTFSEAVDVTGEPTLALSFDKGERDAVYQQGTGTATLQFTYDVTETDRVSDALTSTRRLLALPSDATIARKDHSTVAAYLGLVSLEARLTVNLNVPRVEVVEVIDDGEGIVIVFDRFLSVEYETVYEDDVIVDFIPTSSPPPLSAFSVTIGGGQPVSPVTVTLNLVQNFEDEVLLGSLSLSFEQAIPGGVVVELAYDTPASDGLLDVDGNEVASFDVGVNNPLDAPAEVRVSAGNGSIDVDWDPLVSGVSPSGGYKVLWAMPDDTDENDDPFAIVTADMTAYTITGLTNGDTYVVRVRPLHVGESFFAVTEIGEDGHYEALSEQVTVGGVPDAPTGVTASTVSTAGSSDMAWTVPDEGGAPITGYTVQWRTDAQTWAEAGSADVTNVFPSTYEITGLDPSSEYFVRIRAINSIGNGEWSPDTALRDLFELSWVTTDTVVVEGGPDATVTLALNPAPTEDVTVGILALPIPSSLVYEGVPSTVTFDSDSTPDTDGRLTESFVVTFDDDDIKNDFEVGDVLLRFDELPSDVVVRGRTEALVRLVDNEVLAGASVVPDGTEIGDEFRLLFVTSSAHDATSTDIADYNKAVQRVISNTGHNDIGGAQELFRALGSTESVNARDNTATNYTTDDPGVAIWWLNGPRAAENYEDFYDGSWENRDARSDEGGDVVTANSFPVATGSTSDGSSDSSGFLGADSVRVGSLDRGDGNEISLGLNTSPASSIFRLYGLSFVLQAAVPSDRPYVVNGGVVVVNPPSDGNYETADTITVEVTFSEAVTVTGKPTFPLLIGSVTRFMAYASGSDSAKLVFTYDVAEQDSDLDGISSARRLLSVPSTDAITAVLDNTKRVYDGPLNLSTGLTVNLDTDPPSPGSGAQLDSVDRKIIEFPFDEKLDTDRDPPAVSVFTVTVDGTEADLVSVEFNDSVDLLDHIIKLTMSTAIAAGATVTVGYDNPDDATALADAAGNQVETFSGAIVANIPAAPVVSLIAGDGKITASWNEPADGGESIVSYEVRYKAAGNTGYTLVNRTDTAALTETIIGLDNGTEYTVQVRAETDSDVGPWSTPVLATPVASMNSAPGGPHLFWGNTKVLVRWIPPAGAADDSDLEGWLVQWKDPAGTAQEQEWSTDRQSSVSKFHDADGDGTDDWLSFELEISLHNDTEYDFRVGARFAGDDVEWTDLATTTAKLVEDDIPSIFTSDLRFGRLDEEETFGADRTKIAIRFRDHAIRTVTAEGLADYTVRRTFYFADYPGEPQYPITAIFFNVVSKHSDPPPGRTITTLHEGAGPDDWGGFDYPPSYMDIPSSLFTLFWAATAAGGRSANGQVHQGANPGEQNIQPTSVPQEKAVLGAPVVGDGELTVVWQDLLWAGTEAYDYQLCVQWKSGMEEFDDGLDDEGNTISSGLGDRTVILSNQERTDALINGSYTVAGLTNGTSYDVRVAYCEAGESSTKIDPSTISNVMSATTESGLTVPHDWSLRPDGVPTGETFHLLFVTSTTRDALSGDIADYDAHVQAALADGGHTDIRDYSSQFKALAGTAGGAAPKSHTGTDPVDGPGVEIWWLNGPKAADDYDDFYDYDRANGANCGFNADCYDGWGHSNPARVETGESKTFLDPGVTGQNLEDVFVWTGVWFNGERASEWHLGTTREIIAGVGAATFGVPYENDQVWLRSGNGTTATLQNFEQGGSNISAGSTACLRPSISSRPTAPTRPSPR